MKLKKLLIVAISFFMASNVLAADVMGFTELQTALGQNSVSEINIKNDITTEADLALQANPNLTIKTDNPNGVTLDGGNLYHGLMINEYNTGTYNSLVIEDNIKFQNFTNQYYGAVYTQIYTNSSAAQTYALTLGNNLSFYNNKIVDGYGAAVFNFFYAPNATNTDNTLNIGSNAYFESNGALHGGAVYNSIKLDGANTGTSTLNIGQNATFTGNSASGTNASGGAVVNYAYASGSGKAVNVLNIGQGALFANNTSVAEGGAIFNRSHSETGTTENILNIEGNTTFSGNSAGGYGGAIFHLSSGAASDKSQININTDAGDVLFTNNTDTRGLNDIFMDSPQTDLNITGNSNSVIFESGIANNRAADIKKTGTNTLVLGKDSVNDNFTGTFTQSAGVTNVLGTSFFAGVNNISDSTLNLLSQAASMSISSLNLSNADINSADNTATAYNIASMDVDGVNNFSLDITSATDYDTFTIAAATGSGTINISEINLVNPITDDTVSYQIFNVTGGSVQFTSSADGVNTPIFNYAASSDGSGAYSLKKSGFNKQAFRGQVATLAMLNNQTTINNTVLNHIYIDSGIVSQNTGYAPYHVLEENGGFWVKGYAGYDDIDLSHNINAYNTMYGTIIGRDFKPLTVGRDWQFLPTIYAGYNGSRQSFNKVTMHQNGGQGGFMGNLYNGNFVVSMLAYGGAYDNDMKLNGTTDNTTNWFAGTALKSAYNFAPAENIILQPALAASYNVFGKQNWNSDYGDISMNSGMLNGLSITPGINLVYNKNTWNTYITAQYVHYINSEADGRAGGAALSDTEIKDGFFEYGAGLTKAIEDRFLASGQVLLANGGKSSVGFNVAFTYKF